MHAFFRDSAKRENGNSGFANEDDVSDRVNFPDFVRVLAHFRPLKKNVEKNKLNGREEKLRCELPCCLMELAAALIVHTQGSVKDGPQVW